VHRKRKDIQATIACHRRATELNPLYAQAFHALGEALLDDGNAAEGIDCFKKAATLKPADASYHSDYLFGLCNLPGITPDRLFQEHQDWSRRHEVTLLGSRQAHENDPAAERRLRIGYISADFREHTTARFIGPLLANHDHKQFEIICYSDVKREDAITQKLKRFADTWRQSSSLTHEALAAAVRADKVDILMDVTGHMGGNRLPVFARKPAPIQITYRGYPNTSGLEAMDYVITDERRDPAEVADAIYSERIIRLAGASQCYGMTDEEPQVTPLPALQGEPFTFGCLNRPGKYSPIVVELWARILRTVPASRLLLQRGSDSAGPRHLIGLFAGQGISPERVIFTSSRPRQQYLEVYQQIDLGLDPFPFNGHTTSLDSLWMGVPFVSLVGDTCMSRIGFSLLDTLGLHQFVATNTEDYVRLAVEQARNSQNLAELRLTLRDRVRQSPLCDAVGHTRALENTFRQVWRQWCHRSQLTSGQNRQGAGAWE
jgi:protein O-GlcNAc transferase